ncbi:MAG: sulfatase family protein [Armatimonadota bacterium]
MKRIPGAVLALLVSLVLGATASGLRRGLAGPAAADRPNILFILTDDQDVKSIVHMPRLKSLLADRGTTFANFFVTYSLCCPSRASILRGQYPHNHQILSNRPPLGGFEKFHALGHEHSTVATWLRGAGYRTMFLGKYLNGYPDNADSTFVPPGWDEWHSPAAGGYANFNYRMNENGKVVAYGNRSEDYMTDVLGRKAADFIRRGAQDRRPFFIHLATYAPHAPATPAPRHQGAFAGATAPRLPSYNEVDVTDKPEWVRDRETLTPRASELIDEHYRTRLRSLLAIDEMIASLLDVLQATGEARRTYVLFTADNGFHFGEHRIQSGKNTPYEESIRAPLIVRGPGVPEGQTLPHLAINTDFAPTFAQIAGAAAPGFVDGRSLLPLLGPNPVDPARWRQAFLVEHYGGAAERPARAQPARRVRAGGIPDYLAMRTRDFLYVEYATGEREFYDVVSDPYELQNVYATRDGVLVRQSAAHLAALRRCAGSGCQTAEDAAAPSLGGR